MPRQPALDVWSSSMAIVVAEVSGSFSGFENWLAKMGSTDTFAARLSKFGEEGTKALASATPVDSGKTAQSWRHEVRRVAGGWEIVWTNDNENQGVNIAVILHYGHGTGTGGYVAGTQYITRAIEPVMERISAQVEALIRGG